MRIERRCRQDGYTLPEALIAAVIAAGVVSAAAQSVGAAARVNNSAERETARLATAKTIALRVRAGMNNDDALKGFDGWEIEREALPPLRPSEPSVLDKVTLSIKGDNGRRLQFLAPALDAGAPR